jgi:hypothetical protein
MNIEFSKECLLDAAQGILNQFSWAWNNFTKSDSEQARNRWQELGVFLLRQYFEIINNAKLAHSEYED